MLPLPVAPARYLSLHQTRVLAFVRVRLPLAAVTADSPCGATEGVCCGCVGTSDATSLVAPAATIGASCVFVAGIASSCAIVGLVSASGTVVCPQPVSSRVVQMVSSMILFIAVCSFRFGSKHNYHTTVRKSTGI